MATVVQKGKSGGLDVSILNLGADVSENQTQKVSLAIRYPTDTEIAKDAATKAKAEQEKAESDSIIKHMKPFG
jgi:hypothetical protein